MEWYYIPAVAEGHAHIAMQKGFKQQIDNLHRVRLANIIIAICDNQILLQIVAKFLDWAKILDRNFHSS